MKWTHVSGLIATASLIGVGGVWTGCNGDNSQNDGGSGDAGNDVNQQDSSTNDTGTMDTGTMDTGTDTGGGGVDASVLDCNYYCTEIQSICKGTDLQYEDKATCMLMCADGIPNDAGAGAMSGDSLACRMYHLSLAAMAGNAAAHCPHAGPYGFGVCGTICDDFCQQYFSSNCKTDTTAYATIDACRTYCATAVGSDAAAGDPGMAPSSNVGMPCREYHLENAINPANDDGGVNSHCNHAGTTGAGVCN